RCRGNHTKSVSVRSRRRSVFNLDTGWFLGTASTTSCDALWVLREELKMTGTKYGCGIAACGACTVHLDGIATRSCAVPVSLVAARPILTIEAMSGDPVGRAVQDAWVEHDVVQCGYCQSGQIMSAVALLKAMPKPTGTDIEESMGGNLCRCA